MSKLYGMMQGCSNGEVTRRGHKSIRSTVKNWDWSVVVQLQDNGGGDKDRLSVTLREINGGKWMTIVEGTIAEIAASDPLASLLARVKGEWK